MILIPYEVKGSKVDLYNKIDNVVPAKIVEVEDYVPEIVYKAIMKRMKTDGHVHLTYVYLLHHLNDTKRHQMTRIDRKRHEIILCYH